MTDSEAAPRRSPWTMLRDFGALSGGELLAKIAGFVAFAWLARRFPPDAYGHIEVAIQVTMMFSLVVDFGLGPIGAREIASNRGRAAALAASIPTLRLILAALAYLLVYLVAGMLDLGEEGRTLARVTGLALFAAPFVHSWLFQGLGKMLWVAAAQLLRSAAFAALVLLCIGDDDGILAVGIFEALSAFVMAAWFVGAQVRNLGMPRLGAPLEELGRLFREAWPVGLSRTLWAVYQYVPTLLVTAIVGGAEVAWFAAAHRLVTSLGSFVNIYHFNLYPQLVEAVAAGQARVDRLMETSFRLTSWAGVAVAVAGTALAVPVCQLAFGEAFARSGPTFAIAIWAVPISFLNSHARFVLIAAGAQRLELAANAAGAVVAALGGAAAVAAAGSEGAGLALVVGAAATWFVAHGYASSRVSPLPLFQPLVRPLLTAAAVLGASTWLMAPGWGSGLTAVVAFAVLAPLVDPALPREALALRGSRSE